MLTQLITVDTVTLLSGADWSPRRYRIGKNDVSGIQVGEQDCQQIAVGPQGCLVLKFANGKLMYITGPWAGWALAAVATGPNAGVGSQNASQKQCDISGEIRPPVAVPASPGSATSDHHVDALPTNKKADRKRK